ncbi:MAG: TlpA disulfide reductase family protein [Armatimonadota bacterium]|nr:TlpA disulfide reductase family protein [Armatimonadota bacterium]
MRRALPYLIGVAVVVLIIYAFQPTNTLREGQTAPDVVLRFTEDGLQQSLSTYRGKVLVLDFWATWCAPCRFTMPKIEEFHQRYKDKGVTVIGVAVDVEDYNQVVQFAKEMGVTYPIAADTSGEAKLYYQIRNLPTLFVIDKDGVIVMKEEGYDPQSTQKKLEEAVQRALQKPAKPVVR